MQEDPIVSWRGAPDRPWRVVILTNCSQSLILLDRLVRANGHSTAAAIMPRPRNASDSRRHGLRTAVNDTPPDVELCMVPRANRIAPLLRMYEPDLVMCLYFPWRVPADALAVPRLGVINGHPSRLPRYRGPQPTAWAVRNGDREIGFTVHRMDEDFDTGPILAQAAVEIGHDAPLGQIVATSNLLADATFARALEMLADGKQGHPQPAAGASYARPFSAEDAWLDTSRPAEEVHNLVRAWNFVSLYEGEQGPLIELDGQYVRVVVTSLTDPVGDKPRLDCADGPLWIAYHTPVDGLRTAGDVRVVARAA
jgi:methionyl-tRNA formyltransferase